MEKKNNAAVVSKDPEGKKPKKSKGFSFVTNEDIVISYN